MESSLSYIELICLFLLAVSAGGIGYEFGKEVGAAGSKEIAVTIIDLTRIRADREKPDKEFIRRDQHGIEMYQFSLEYSMDGKTWSNELWAYSVEDAERRVKAMRGTLTVAGQLYAKA
jgi:hypothetical protein